MTEYLDREDVLTAGTAAVGQDLKVADYGLLDAAVARPQATVYGLDAYPDLFTKAAALLQSLVRNHALVDGNKRTAWVLARLFLALNGVRIAFAPEDAIRTVLALAAGELSEEELADWFRGHLAG